MANSCLVGELGCGVGRVGKGDDGLRGKSDHFGDQNSFRWSIWPKMTIVVDIGRWYDELSLWLGAIYMMWECGKGGGPWWWV